MSYLTMEEEENFYLAIEYRQNKNKHRPLTAQEKEKLDWFLEGEEMFKAALKWRVPVKMIGNPSDEFPQILEKDPLQQMDLSDSDNKFEEKCFQSKITINDAISSEKHNNELNGNNKNKKKFLNKSFKRNHKNKKYKFQKERQQKKKNQKDPEENYEDGYDSSEDCRSCMDYAFGDSKYSRCRQHRRPNAIPFHILHPEIRGNSPPRRRRNSFSWLNERRAVPWDYSSRPYSGYLPDNSPYDSDYD